MDRFVNLQVLSFIREQYPKPNYYCYRWKSQWSENHS